MSINENSYPIKTRINIRTFMKKYHSVLPDDLFVELEKASWNGRWAIITTSTIIELDKRLSERKAKDKKLSTCAKLNNLGKEYEADGKLSLAIKTYEKNITGDCYPATYSFDRLMVLYRKRKDYVNEIRVISKAIKVFTTENERRAQKAIKEYPDKEKQIRAALETCTNVKGALRSTLTGAVLYCFCPYPVNKYKQRLEKARALQAKQSQTK